MRKFRKLAALATVCIAIAGVTHVIRAQLLMAPSSNFREFTVIRVETSQSRSPHPLQRIVLEAQRKDGSTVMGEFEAGNLENPFTRQVRLVPERISVRVNSRVRAKTTRYLKKDTPAPQPSAPDPQCGFSRLLPEAKASYLGAGDDVLGYRTVAIQMEVRLGEEVFVRTDFRAPDLDCRTLKLVEDRRDAKGNITGHFEIRALRVALGAPAQELFEIPKDYAEKSPSELYQAIITQSGGPMRPTPPGVSDRYARQDQSYFENHRTTGLK